jgi:SOS-response transcriptional repressor LexA
VSRIIRSNPTSYGETYQGIPVYSLITAGGPLRDNPETRTIGHIHPPENLKSLEPQYFVVRIEGGSMEPNIPSGSYCLLRYFVPGSRSGRTVLVEERKIGECAYTLKRFRRRPPRPGEAGRGRIVLESINPEVPDIEIEEDGESQDQRYAVIAEFVQVLEAPLNWINSAF